MSSELRSPRQNRFDSAFSFGPPSWFGHHGELRSYAENEWIIVMRCFGCLICSLFLVVPVKAFTEDYIAALEIIHDTDSVDLSVFSGRVFQDLNRDGLHTAGEPGVANVMVSNGRKFVRTDDNGRYRIAAIDNHDLTIVQPSGWRVPVDARQVPQFFYIHKPGGTGYALRYGGLPDTGPVPSAVNFPIIRDGAATEDFTCAVIGDSQTYANREIGWLRDGVVTDLVHQHFEAGDCLLYVGDVMGDDLDLLDRLLKVGAMAGVHIFRDIHVDEFKLS